jgi:hypothetical protein
MEHSLPQLMCKESHEESSLDLFQALQLYNEIIQLVGNGRAHRKYLQRQLKQQRMQHPQLWKQLRQLLMHQSPLYKTHFHHNVTTTPLRRSPVLLQCVAQHSYSHGLSMFLDT